MVWEAIRAEEGEEEKVMIRTTTHFRYPTNYQVPDSGVVSELTNARQELRGIINNGHTCCVLSAL